jgi:Carboxypeptidase regulatory-like domain
MHASLWTCVAALVIGAPGAVRAQATTGSLEGRIVSTQGEPLEHAVVTVSGPFLQGPREDTTDARGHFLLLWLPAGTYGVQMRAVGYSPTALRDVRVDLGATGSLGDVALAPQTVELPEIEVSGAKPLIDPTTAAAATVLDSSAFLALPTDRNFRALTALVPEANAAGAVSCVELGQWRRFRGCSPGWRHDLTQTERPPAVFGWGSVDWFFLYQLAVRLQIRNESSAPRPATSLTRQ